MARPDRILVTRAAHQGSELARLLEGYGLEPVAIPAIRLEPPASSEPIEKALRMLADFDWILFTSTNAVEAFESFCAGRSLPPSMRMAAIGAATAKALDGVGWKANLVPPIAVAESLTEMLLPFAHQPDGRPTRFLLPRAEEGRELLPDALRAAGAEVEVAPVYRTVIDQQSVQMLSQELAQVPPGIAAVTFTSSSTARNFFALCDAAGVVPPEAIVRVSIGPITSETLRQMRFPPHAEAPDATIASLAETVFETLQGRRRAG